MQSVFKAAVEERAERRDVVVATVVKTWGSTPQKQGAKLLVRADGSGVGTLGGGCVEGDIWFAAREILQHGGDSEMRDYTLNEELAAKDGLVCGGTMRFLIDPVRGSDEYGDFAEEIVSAYGGGKPAAIATIVVASPEMKEVHKGQRMLIRENGETKGSLGDDELNRQAVRKARSLMAMGRCEYVENEAGCEYFIETYTTPPTLVLTGGGHVSKALAPVAKSVGMRIFVFDDREEFANRERFPEASIIETGSYTEGFTKMPVNANSFIIIATRGHRHDSEATKAAIDTPASYIGLLGSRRKTILIFEELFKQGMTREDIRRVRSPVGLNIGGRTPEEIAISIIADILAFRLGGDGAPMMLSETLIGKALERAERNKQSSIAV